MAGSRSRIPSMLLAGACLFTLVYFSFRLTRSQSQTPKSKILSQSKIDAERTQRAQSSEVKDSTQSETKIWLEHPSLKGTDVNGRARADAKGQLIVERDFRRLLDYFLSLRGRFSDQEIRQQLASYLSEHLPVPTQAEALRLFDRYVNLLNVQSELAAAKDHQETDMTHQIEAILETRRQMRREFLGAQAAEAFYVAEERYESFQLETLRIEADDNLNAEEKVNAIAEAELILSPEERAERKQTFAYLDVKRAVSDPHRASEALELIEERFGAEAAQRLEAEEFDRQNWEKRRADYQLEKKRLASDPDRSEDERVQALSQWLSERFSASEIRRLEALESDSTASIKSGELKLLAPGAGPS